MKILILSLYYKPDLSAGSFRCTALVEQLKKTVFNGSITIITSMPSRYSSYDVSALPFEQQDNVSIRRIALPAHNSNTLQQALGYLRFANQAIQLTKLEQYDLVFASSSRLMTAVLGAYIAFKKQAKLYLDIRDIFLSTSQEVLSKNLFFFIKPVLSIIEKWTFKRADKINIVSPEFKSYFNTHYNHIPLAMFTNGVDDEFIQTENINRSNNIDDKDKITVVYAGNIGEGQGLHRIIPQLANQLKNKVHFKIIGDGSRKVQLQDKINEYNCTNVELLPPIKRDKLAQEYQNADVLFIHLNDFKAFEQVLPSKLFEYAASGKPIWAGLGGYSANFTKNEIENAAMFAPCNPDEAEQAFSQLKFTSIARTQFVAKYSRTKIMRDMSMDLVSLIEE